MSTHSLENILDKLDPSVKEKFDRCSRTDWCLTDASDSAGFPKHDVPLSSGARAKKIAVKNTFKRFKLARKVAKKLVCMKTKTSKSRKLSNRFHTTETTKPKIDTLIAKGSNTPASSRPNSISMTMEQLERDCRSSEWRLNAESAASSISVGS